MAVARPTGQQPGALTVGAKPRTADEAALLAVALVEGLLPPSVQAWLNAAEYHRQVAASVGGTPPAPPERVPDVVELVRANV